MMLLMTPVQNGRKLAWLTTALLTGSLGLALPSRSAHAQTPSSILKNRSGGGASGGGAQRAPSPPPAPRVSSPPMVGADRARTPSTILNPRSGSGSATGRRQGSVDYNALFSHSGTGYRVAPDGGSAQQRAIDELYARAQRTTVTPNPPNRLHDVLFGGTVPNSVPNEPDRLHDVLFGGRAIPQTNRGPNFNRFQNSTEGFIYQNGIVGRNHYHSYYGPVAEYFANGYGFYPYYYPSYLIGITSPSLYSYYYGVCPPYIAQGYIYQAPPSYGYVPAPIYNDIGRYQGWRSDDVDDYYLNQNRNDKGNKNGEYRIGEPNSKLEPAVERAVKDIRKSWQEGDIQSLSKHVRRDSRIAVYLRGKYQYSMEAGDYLDMTRDAFIAMKTLRFELDTARRKENGVYTVSGRHVYRNKDAQQRTVYVSFVLEKMDEEYIITQVGTAPDLIEE